MQGITDPEKPTHTMSILFLQLEIHKNDFAKNFTKNKVRDKMMQIYASCEKMDPPSFLAYYLFSNSKEFENLSSKLSKKYNKTHYYPGVIIFGRIQPIPKP